MQTKKYHYIAASVLLWLLFAQTTFEARLTSLTTDEPLHIISGYSYLKTGDPRLVEEHPLLTKSIAAMPLLLLSDLGDPRQARGWPEAALVTVTRAMLLNYPAIDRVAFAARVPIMWLGMLMAALVYRWAADWHRRGQVAGLIALALCMLDPNIVAHAQLATTDIGVTLFILATFYALWRWTRRRSFKRLALTGIMLGMALASKMSALIALPVIVLIVLIAFAQPHRDSWRGAFQQFGRAVAMLVAMVGIAAVIVWAVYGFEVCRLPNLPLPLPACSHLIPLERLFEHQRAGHSTFLLGQNSQMGWWYYFPVAFAFKTPLPTLLFLLGAAALRVTAIIKRWRRRERPIFGQVEQALVLLAFPVVYLASATVSTVDIGFRHLLPIVPFIFVFIAIQLPKPSSPISNLLIITLLAWNVVNAIIAAPRPLEFFNELAGGPSNGWKYLVDSNLDWGQSFKELKRYLDEHGIEHTRLSAMMFLEPTVYGLDYDPLPPSRKGTTDSFSRFNPEPGMYVISASSLQGAAIPDINLFASFRSMTPTAQIGNALFVYNVPQARNGTWVAQCRLPAARLSDQDIDAGFGHPPLRHVYFDCARSWWYPSGGLMGWYISSPGHSLDPAEWFSGSTITARMRTADGQPLFEIAHVPHPTPPDGLTKTARTDQGVQVSAPVNTTGPLAFEGYWLRQSTNVRPGSQVMILTAWRVTAVPTQMVSILAHLAADDGHVLATGDGLDVPIESWSVGDLIVQAHWLDIPDHTAPGMYRVTTGIYTLDNLKRFSVLSEGKQTGDQLILMDIQIR